MVNRVVCHSTPGFTAPPPPSCVDAMGLEKGWVPNSLMTASSSYNTGLGPYNARLNFVAGSGRNGGWAARTNDVNQWLQVRKSNGLHTAM